MYHIRIHSTHMFNERYLPSELTKFLDRAKQLRKLGYAITTYYKD
jgi:hypothetical protein